MMLTKFCDVYAKMIHKTMMFLGIALIFAVALQVAGRYVPFVPRYLWPLELSNFTLIWLVFLGSIIGLRENRHFNVDLFLNKKLPLWLALFLKLVYYIAVGTVTYIFIIDGYTYFFNWGLIQRSEITGISQGFLYISVPFAGVSWAVFLIERIAKDIVSFKTTGEVK